MRQRRTEKCEKDRFSPHSNKVEETREKRNKLDKEKGSCQSGFTTIGSGGDRGEIKRGGC